MLIFGIILLIVGVICFFLARSAKKKLAAILGTETFSSKALVELYQAALNAGERGKFSKPVEIQGTTACDAPLTAELSKERCLFYRSEIIREVEESCYETDSQTGTKKLCRKKRYDTISDTTGSTDFFVEDATGRTKVCPEHADMELVKVLDRLEPENSSSFHISANTFSFGGISFACNLGNLSGLGNSSQILGYRLREHILPVGKYAFVLGEASDNRGELVVGKPAKAKVPFLISSRSEEQLRHETARNRRSLVFAWLACLGLGTVLTSMGIMNHALQSGRVKSQAVQSAKP